MGKKLIALAALMLSFSACNLSSTGSPGGVLNLAFNSIQKAKLSDFQGALTGQALKEYGTAEGLALLKNRLSSYKDINVANYVVIKKVEGDQGDGFHGDVLRVYSCDVLSTQAFKSKKQKLKIFSATVDCNVSMGMVQSGENCHGGGGGPDNYEPPTCSPDYSEEEFEDCRVSSLQF